MAHFNPRGCSSTCCPCSFEYDGCSLIWKCTALPTAVKVVQVIDEVEVHEWIIVNRNFIDLGGHSDRDLGYYDVYMQSGFGLKFIKVHSFAAGLAFSCDLRTIPDNAARKVTIEGIEPIDINPLSNVTDIWGCLNLLNGTYIFPKVEVLCFWYNILTGRFGGLSDNKDPALTVPITVNDCDQYEQNETGFAINEVCVRFSTNSTISRCSYLLEFYAINSTGTLFGQPAYWSVLLDSNTNFSLLGGILVPCSGSEVTIDDVAFYSNIDFTPDRRVSTFGRVTIEEIEIDP